MAGRANKKEKVKAREGLTPRMMAAAMVLPEREMPGRMARA